MAIRPVYSTRFLAWASSEEPPAYTVPDGYVAVVHCVSVTTGGGAITNFKSSINDVATFSTGSFTEESTPQEYLWQGRVVVNAGEIIVFESDEATDGAISGYLLDSP